MLRMSSSTTSTRRPRSASSLRCSCSIIFCLRRWQIGDHAVQEQRRLIEQSLRRLHPLETMLLALRRSSLCSASVSSRPVNTTIGISLHSAVQLHPIEQLEAGHVGQAQIEHDAVETALPSSSSASAPVPAERDCDVVVIEQLADAQLFRRIVLDHQQLPHARLGKVA